MRLHSFRLLCCVAILLIVIGCANRGNPSGGDIDTDPPVIVRADPENFSTNFNSDEIRIYFNEYIKIKNIQKQLIVSPPMDTNPVIYPLGGASEYISIKIKDTLEDNTTYAFNFGQSIVDNNEENPYPYYRYVFSTGNTIDSLSVKGMVVDALKQQPDTFIAVALYEADSIYSDSLVFKEKPRYITNTLDSLTTFSIDNVKEGTYKLLALKDKNNNYIFDQKTDKIAFLEEFITVPKDTIYTLKLFKEVTNFKAERPKQESKTKIIFPYEGDYKDMRIKISGDTPQGYKSRIVKSATTDTLNYWYKPDFEADTSLFVVSNKTYVDTLKHRYRNLETDSLEIKKIVSGVINFDQDFTLEGNIPFVKIDTTKIKLIDKDSLNIPFRVKYDSLLNRYTFPVEKQEGKQYKFTMLPGTFEDFYEGTNKDTLVYGFRTKLESEYGNIRVNIRNAKFPLIVQLVDKDGKVQYERYATDSPVVDFTNIPPRQYWLRAIFDTNENKKYDTGNYLLGVQPERVSYAPKLDEVRANFDQIVEFTLLE